MATVFSGAPGEAAGLAAGDQLLAIDGLKLTPGNWANRMETLRPGATVSLALFRGDELLTVAITPVVPPADTWTLTLAEAVGEVLARRQAWLGL